MNAALSRAAVGAFAMAASLALAQQDFSKVEVRATKLTETTYMLSGAGGNLGLSVGEDAVFLVDDQFAPLSEKIAAAIRAITPKPVRFVLNTHWHGDHSGGNEHFGKAGAVVISHENVRKRMSTEQFNEFLRRSTPPAPRGALPVVTFNGAMTFHINGEEVRAIHVPRAHTDGDSIVHFLGSDVIHMGDIFFNGLFPFIDTASGGSVDGTIAACDQVLAIATDKTKIIPGHGALATRADLQAYRDMLVTVSGRIRKMLAEGRKLEEIAAANVSAEWDAKWSWGFIPTRRFAEMIAHDLRKGR